MGWLLSIWMFLPLVNSDVEFRMWFSRESYCTFAQAKFTENPVMHSTLAGPDAAAKITKSSCRKLRDDEAHLIPKHMRN